MRISLPNFAFKAVAFLSSQDTQVSSPHGPPQADPTIYPRLREQALNIRLPNLASDALHAIVMDWPIPNGTTTVLAAADGTASIYLSSGGGFIGGSQSVPALKSAALHAIRLATHDHGDARPVTETPIPTSPNQVFFYFIYESGVLLTRVNEATLRDGTNRLKGLGIAMQNIITQYRLWHEQRRAK